MKCKEQYDKNIVMRKDSFIAYFFYVSQTHTLNLVLRSGKQYQYVIDDRTMNGILEANNRGSYIAQNIVHNRALKCEYVQTIPQATIEQITLPKSVHRWLAK